MLRLLFSFYGRMRRSTWWLVRLGFFAAAAVAVVVSLGVSLTIQDPNLVAVLLMPPFLAVIVVLSIADIATCVKRLHDVNLSGWFYLMALVPLVGPLFILIVCGFIDGTRGRNPHGPSAKYPEHEQTAAVFA